MNDISLNIYGQDLSEGGKQPVLIPFLTDDPAGKITVVIIPGGGYNHISLEKEGEAIAGAFNAMQVNAFVLDYRVPARRADFLSDAVRAVQYVRFHSENFGISRNPLIVMGFSAGAHLALMEAQHWQEVHTGNDAAANESARPDGLILGYPVVTFTEPYAHRGSRSYFLGPEDADDPKLWEYYSAEKHITADFPPVFIWHCEGDDTVPVENSRMLRDALQQAGVDHRLITYPGGAHGIGLAPDDPVIKGWFPACVNWLRTQVSQGERF